MICLMSCGHGDLFIASVSLHSLMGSETASLRLYGDIRGDGVIWCGVESEGLEGETREREIRPKRGVFVGGRGGRDE